MLFEAYPSPVVGPRVTPCIGDFFSTELLHRCILDGIPPGLTGVIVWFLGLSQTQANVSTIHLLEATWIGLP